MEADQLEYARDGVQRLPALVDAPTLERLRAAVDAAHGDAAPDGPHGILRHNPWRRLPAFAEVLAAGAVARRLCELLAVPALRLFQDNLVWKTPAVATGIAWHQDYAYWPLSAPDGVTLWLALDDADAANGCLHYLPGSQRWGEGPPAAFLGGADGGAPPVGAARVVALPARAGDGIAHHPLTWHMSPGNGSGRHRRAWSSSFVGLDVRWQPAHAPHPFNHELSPVAGAPLTGELFPRLPC